MGANEASLGTAWTGCQSIYLKKARFGLGEHRGPEPWPVAAIRCVCVYADGCGGDSIGDGGMQRRFRKIELIACAASQPFVELCDESEHTPGRIPLSLRGDVQAQPVAPVNVAKAVESGVGRDRFRWIKREVGRDQQRDSFAVVQVQTALDMLVAGAIEGDVDD